MKQVMSLILTMILLTSPAMVPAAGMKGRDVKSMPKEEQIKIAESAAPPDISKNATIMVIGEDGKLVEVKKGTNGFTCIPDIDEQEVADPICADEASMQWVNDLVNGAPKPTNTIPGISYMAQGGWHWEKEGKILMDRKEHGAKRVKEPPHWMVLWPFDSKVTGLPHYPQKFGTYLMFEGTPYSHLMIYQDPAKLK